MSSSHDDLIAILES